MLGWAELNDCHQDPEAEARRREEHAYAGPYVKGWDQATESRVLERDASGKPVVVRQRQRELFGTAWTRTWQEGGSRARGDVMEEEVGPSGETAGVEVAPPAGVTWEGLAEMQRRERKGYERAKTRGLRGEREILAAVREFFRGVRRKLRESRGWGRKVEVPRGEGGGKVAEMRSSEGLDSGYASMVKG